jgi:DNA-directed RNA polymerase subunit L
MKVFFFGFFFLFWFVEVEFAGYTVPHPLINEMNLRVSTTGRGAMDVTQESVGNLIGMLDFMLDKFEVEFP